MLVAEIHGKVVPEALNDEDFLTSAIFGHLRYLPPNVFWTELFSLAKSLPDTTGREHSLSEVIAQTGGAINQHTELKAHFWSRHPQWGEPDLVLCFSGEGPPLIILIEIKLWSGKSGEEDQLVRYLRVLDDLAALRPQPIPDHEGARRYLVYLTPRESLTDVQESIEAMANEQHEARSRVFRLQWQDVEQVARAIAPTLATPSQAILEDVARFLQVRGLEHFKGFTKLPALEIVSQESGNFYEPLNATQTFHQFSGWTHVQGLGNMVIRRGEWNL